MIPYLLGFPGAITFNGMNKLMFNIGVFPISMSASLLLFVHVHHARRMYNRLGMASNLLFGTRFYSAGMGHLLVRGIVWFKAYCTTKQACEAMRLLSL